MAPTIHSSLALSLVLNLHMYIISVPRLKASPPFQVLLFFHGLSRFKLPCSGWRRTVVINCILAGVLAVIMVALALSAARISGSFHGNSVFWSGPCDTASTVNLILHLVLNIASTAILASSKFFMQVVSSPSRREVDVAHERKRWIDIRVLSLRNLRYVSGFKATVWTLFMLTSVPIHLVFNSIIFEIEYAGKYGIRHWLRNRSLAADPTTCLGRAFSSKTRTTALCRINRAPRLVRSAPQPQMAPNGSSWTWEPAGLISGTVAGR